MRKSAVFPFLLVGMVLTFVCFIFMVAVPFFNVNNSGYYGYSDEPMLFANATPGLFGYTLVTIILTFIGFIVCLVKMRDGTSKGPGFYLIFAICLEILAGFIIFFFSVTSSDYTLTGGIAYIIFIIIAQIMGLVGATRFNQLVSYIPPKPVKKTTSSSSITNISSRTYSSSSSSSSSSASASKIVKFPSETEFDDAYAVEFYEKHVFFKFTDKNTKGTGMTAFYYDAPVTCSTIVSEDCIFFTVKARDNSSSAQYKSNKEITLRLNNINNNKVNTFKLVLDLEKEMKKHFISFSNSGNQASNEAKATLNNFEGEFGMEFETFKSLFKTSLCGKKPNVQFHSIFMCKSKKLFYIVGENEKDPALILLSQPKTNFRADEYKILLASTNVSGIKTYLYNYADIIDVKYYDKTLQRTMDEKPAVSKLAKEDDASAGFSHYILYFKSNPTKTLFVDKNQAALNDDLESFVSTFKAKKNPSAAEAKANAKNKSPIAELLRKEEQKPAAKAQKSNVVLSKEAPAPKAAIQAPKLDKKAEVKPAATSAHQSKTKVERLKELKELLDAGLITQEEYNSAREAIIKD